MYSYQECIQKAVDIYQNPKISKPKTKIEFADFDKDFRFASDISDSDDDDEQDSNYMMKEINIFHSVLKCLDPTDQSEILSHIETNPDALRTIFAKAIDQEKLLKQKKYKLIKENFEPCMDAIYQVKMENMVKHIISDDEEGKISN